MCIMVQKTNNLTSQVLRQRREGEALSRRLDDCEATGLEREESLARALDVCEEKRERELFAARNAQVFYGFSSAQYIFSSPCNIVSLTAFLFFIANAFSMCKCCKSTST